MKRHCFSFAYERVSPGDCLLIEKQSVTGFSGMKKEGNTGMMSLLSFEFPLQVSAHIGKGLSRRLQEPILVQESEEVHLSSGSIAFENS